MRASEAPTSPVFDPTYHAAGIRASEGVKFVLGGMASPAKAHFLYTYSDPLPFGDAPKYKFL